MQIGSTNTSTINLGVSGDTVNIPSGVTIANAGTATGFGESNTPYFEAKLSAGYTITSTTATLLAANSEVHDSGGCYNNTDRKSTRLNSSHGYISYAVFCLKQKNSAYTHCHMFLNIMFQCQVLTSAFPS